MRTGIIKTFVVVAIVAGITLPSVSLGVNQAQDITLIPGNCFDFYNFNSVKVDATPQLNEFLAGSQARFFLKVTNENSYPIVDGSIYIKIVKKQTDPVMAQENGGLVIDQFFVKNNLSLDANEIKEFNFLWDVPGSASAGDYQILTYFQSAKQYDLLGLAFSDIATGGKANFKIKSDTTKTVSFDKNGVRLNNEDYIFNASSPQFAKDDKVSIEIPLVNQTQKEQRAEITYDLYFWDGLKSESLEAKKETVTLKPGETKTLTYETENNAYPVYYLVAKSKWGNLSSILGIRFAREEVNRPRIVISGIDSFPLIKDTPVNLFACLSSTGLAESAPGKLEVSVNGPYGELIQNFTYQGDITGSVMGLRGQFIPDKNLDNFKIKTTLYDGSNNPLEETELSYNCENINPDKCLQKSPPSEGYKQKALIFVLIGFGIIVIIGLIFLILRKKGSNPPASGNSVNYSTETESIRPPSSPNITARIVTIIILSASTLLLGTMATSGEVISQNFGPIDQWSTHWTSRNPNPPPIAKMGRLKLENVMYEISYNAVATENDGSPLQNGDKIPSGTIITFSVDPSSFLPSGSDSAYWFTLGNIGEIHLGHWHANADPDLSCSSADKVDNIVYYRPGGGAASLDIFAPLSLDPPNISFSEFAGIDESTCIGSPDGYSVTCTVAGQPGEEVRATATFPPTYFKHYMTLGINPSSCQAAETNMVPGVTGGNPNWPRPQTDVGGVSIPFNFEIAGEDGDGDEEPPVPGDEQSALLPPEVIGPESGKVNINYTFSANSSSSNLGGSGQIEYGFDWDSNNIVDYWTNSTPPQDWATANFTWTIAGPKVFKVKAKSYDNGDNQIESDWTNYSVNIQDEDSDTSCEESETWTTCSASCGGGTKNLIKVDSECNVSIIDTQECNIQSCGGIIITEVPPGGGD